MGILVWFLYIPVLFGPQLGRKVTWKGYLTQQSSIALASRYDFELWVSGKTSVPGGFEGRTTIRLQTDTAVYGIMEFEGTAKGNNVSIRETRIREQNIYFMARWYVKTLQLRLSADGEKTTLTGKWFSEDRSDEGGVYLEAVESF